jgi:hypothetical protein
VPPDQAAPYRYREEIGHLLEMKRVADALALLTRFEYLIDRLWVVFLTWIRISIKFLQDIDYKSTS